MIRRADVTHRTVAMAVVVQRMVAAQAAGVLFTADPVTSHRKVATVEATFGLGEALVFGQVVADVHQVRDGQVVASAIGPQLKDTQCATLKINQAGSKTPTTSGCW